MLSRLVDAVPDHPYNPWTLQRYYTTREEGEAVAESFSLDLGRLHNEVNEWVRGPQFTRYHAALEAAEAYVEDGTAVEEDVGAALLEFRSELDKRMTARQDKSRYHRFDLHVPEYDRSFLQRLDLFVEHLVGGRHRYCALQVEAQKTVNERLSSRYRR